MYYCRYKLYTHTILKAVAVSQKFISFKTLNEDGVAGKRVTIHFQE